MRFPELTLIGWMFFLASSVGFTVSSYQSGDPAALAGSVLFLLGCVFFLVPSREAAVRTEDPDCSE